MALLPHSFSGQIPGWYSLPPPQLAGNTPVANIGFIEPGVVHVPEMLWVKLHLTTAHCFQGHVGEFFHVHKPLQSQAGFNHGIGALGAANFGAVIFQLDQMPGFLQHFADFLTGYEAVFTNQDLGLLVEFGVFGEDINHGQVVPLPDFVVVLVVRRGDF